MSAARAPFTSNLMLPTTVRFVAVVKGEVVATLSLVQDSDLGLPLESAYGDAVWRVWRVASRRWSRAAGLDAVGPAAARRAW